MKKSYKIEVDCPNCALKWKRRQKAPGVVDACVNFIFLKMKVGYRRRHVDSVMNRFAGTAGKSKLVAASFLSVGKLVDFRVKSAAY